MNTHTARTGIAAALALVVVLTAAAAVAVAAPQPTVKRGKVLFVAACGSCHALAAAKTNGTSGPNLGRGAGSYAEIVAQVQRGGEGMPSFGGKLTRVQIGKIAAFLVATTPRGGGGEDD